MCSVVVFRLKSANRILMFSQEMRFPDRQTIWGRNGDIYHEICGRPLLIGKSITETRHAAHARLRKFVEGAFTYPHSLQQTALYRTPNR